MTDYKHLVLTTRWTYRLWDKDIIDSIDLSHEGGAFVDSILTDVQRSELWDYKETELTDAQYANMRTHYVLPARF